MKKNQVTFMQGHKQKFFREMALVALTLAVFATAGQGQNNHAKDGAPAQTYTVGFSSGDPDSEEHIGMVPLWTAFMGAKCYYGVQRQHHHSQTVYTADKLQPLVGSRISKISYRIFDRWVASSFDWQAQGEVKMAATTATNVRYDFVDMAALSPVAFCSASFKYTNLVMEFEFEEPLVYFGGNIVVDMMKYAGTGLDYGVSFMGGSTCYADDPWNQEWKKNPDNWVTRLHLTVNKKENYHEAWHRFPEITFHYTPFNFYQVTASATPGGLINRKGEVCVEEAKSQTCTFTPNQGYKVAQVLIDGINNREAVANGYYTFGNVQAHHTIAAMFEPLDIKVYSYLNTLYIKKETDLQLEKVEINDMMGNIIYQSVIKSDETVIPLQVENGFYHVKLIEKNKVIYSTKVSVTQ
jgi:hypothetical protein